MTPNALRLPRAVGLAVLVMVGMHAGPAAAESVVFNSGLVGVLGGQRARLNVVDTGKALRGNSCSIELSFLDSTGQEIAKTEMVIDPSHAASFEHASPPDRSGPGRREQFLVRGRVTTTGEPCVDSELVPTLEVLDPDGKTLVLLSPALRRAVGPVLATSAVFRAGTDLACFVANVSQSKTVVVDIEAVDDTGGSEVLVTQTIAPRVVSGALSQPTGRLIGYCRFVLRSGSKEDVRASYCVVGETALDCAVTGDAR